MELVIRDKEDLRGFLLVKEGAVNRPHIPAVIADEMANINLIARFEEAWRFYGEGGELKREFRELVCVESDGAEPRTGFAFWLHVEECAARDVRKKMCH